MVRFLRNTVVVGCAWFDPVLNLASHPPTKRHAGRRNPRSSFPALAALAPKFSESVLLSTSPTQWATFTGPPIPQPFLMPNRDLGRNQNFRDRHEVPWGGCIGSRRGLE